MATNLYETLGLDKNASPEDIRKAYRKRALKTHPDRLPPQTSDADKAAASEAFRKVNNAYEVLSDEKNRKLYDRYGVWPPPTGPEPGAGPSRTSPQTSYNEPFSDPFFSSGFGSRAFHFTDPFVLFNSLFGDIHNLHRAFFEDDDPFFSDPFPSPFSSRSPFGDPFGLSTRSPFGSLFGPGPMFSGLLESPNTRVYSQVSEAVGRNGQWVSQSTMTRSINGRTEQITKRRDAQGNEHIVYSSPEGERYTINGVDQPLPVTNGNTNPGRIAAPQPPPPQTRPAPQAITAAPPAPAPSYVPPQAQPAPVPVQVTSPPPPPTYYAPSTTSHSHTYPTKPAGPFDRAPAAHRESIPADPRSSVHRTRSGSSHGHGGAEYGASSHAGHVHARAPATPPPPTAAYATSLHSYRPPDQERHHRRDSHHTHASGASRAPDTGRTSHHSHRDSYQPVPEPPRVPAREEQGAPPHKRWHVGGWLNGLTKFLKNHVRRHESAGAHY